MRIVIIGLVFAAVILAGGTAYLLNSYLSSQRAEIASKAPKAPTSQVLVAKADMPAGTVVNDKNTEWVPWPEDALQDSYQVKTREKNPLTAIIKDKHVARRAILKGDPITMAKIYKADHAGFMRGTLHPGMRAIAVKSTPDNSSAGFILPGDRVDMMLTHSLLRRAIDRTGETSDTFNALEFTSETILENLNVLAVDQKVNEFDKGAALGKTMLLEVTPKQAEIINTAKVMGTLSLVLRSAENGEVERQHSFTTDVEVSPMLSNFKSFMAGSDLNTKTPMLPRSSQGPAFSSDDPDYIPEPEPIPRPAPPLPAPRVSKPAPQAAARTNRPLTIYRGVGTPPQSVGDTTNGGGNMGAGTQ
ncbi:Flp pilus assembly protein CpaB [Magnetovibrio blakemorei]|uniref:Flp pilus assembly protein CpaB n=1 Tax=Magnetovibrio blakemorei TaxID=28181 RepID=A0A1E5QAH4_9PROT|nr:Flp pilus assembly protein CpaB [Magnetovibrio blakemorei]OEJ68932.1 Flp pilus assembly protein CpaB [Magnetovibrio blakemorei]